ncbi:MAG: glycosyltransferase [Planctomycetota bacterium]
MIFVTVGHQMPFDRLIAAVDAWAGARGRSDVFAQIGTTSLRPAHVQFADKIEPAEFKRRMQQATAVVAHAGMGSILTALECGTPILVMPRLGRLQETRNDHQVATAERMKALGRVVVAMDEHELPAAMDRLADLARGPAIAPQASPELLAAVRAFVFDGR